MHVCETAGSKSLWILSSSLHLLMWYFNLHISAQFTQTKLILRSYYKEFRWLTSYDQWHTVLEVGVGSPGWMQMVAKINGQDVHPLCLPAWNGDSCMCVWMLCLKKCEVWRYVDYAIYLAMRKLPAWHTKAPVWLCGWHWLGPHVTVCSST